MRQAGVIRYLVVAALLLLLAACGQFPGMRTNMPPTPAEPPPGAAAPAPAQPGPGPGPTGTKPGGPGAAVGEPVGATGRPQRAAPAKPRALPAPPPPVPPPRPPACFPGSEKNYTEGMRLYHAKKFGEAQNQLHQYLKSQPKGPKAPEARYYLADSFYQEGKYQEAGVEFNKLRLQFPQSILAPAGLLRQALCYKNQQQMGTYRSTLQKLVKAYPNSPEAKEAQKMLKESPKQAVR